MTISAINSPGIYNPLTTVNPTENPEDRLVQHSEEDMTRPAPATMAEDITIEPETDTEAKGVLRLLQAGHFKGVADVRLRINFHDEIAAMEAEKGAQVTADGVNGIAHAVSAEVDAYLGGEIDAATGYPSFLPYCLHGILSINSQ